MKNLNRTLVFVFVFIIGLFVCADSVLAVGEDFEIYGGSTTWGFYDSGYSDGWYWGESARHSGYGNHEMLSGEFAAALAWSQSGSNDAIWFQNPFEYPNVTTNSTFQGVPISGNNSWIYWNDANNPIDNYDTAYSVIQDSLYSQNSLRIRIDYEVVDLGEQDANGVGGSPLSFKDANETVAYVNSERWVLLCTYSVTNISDSNITDIEFYQMLC